MNIIYQKFQEAAEKYSNKKAIVELDRDITYGELTNSINEVMEFFSDNSIIKGDVVVFICDNSIEYLIFYLAACKKEICFVPVDTRLTDEELLRITNIVKPNFIICKNKYKKTGEEIMKNTSDKSFSCLEYTFYGNLIYLFLYNTKIDKNPEFKDSDFTVLFSSGTTGGAKGVVFSQDVIVNQISIYSRYFKMTPDDRVLCPVTLIHSYGIFDHALSTLMIGATLYLPDISLMNPKMLLELVHKNQITFFGTLPYMYELMAQMKTNSQYDFSSIRYMICGGAPLNKETIEKFFSKFKKNINQVYGLTEVGYICFNNNADKRDSIGKSFSELILKVVDQNDNECKFNEEGELKVKIDKMIARGYLSNEFEQNAMYKNGWFYTKDIVSIDQDGYLYYKGRISDFINIGGNKVHPSDIESVINMVPGVKENVVLGLNTNFGDQEICSVIVPTSFENLKEIQIMVQDQCMKKLVAFKRPKKIYFIKAFQTTNLGKISKGRIKELLSKDSPTIIKDV